MTAQQIADKYVAKFGLGFHPDTPGKAYRPKLTPDEVREYDADVETLFSFDCDPYEVAIDAWKRAGLV